MTRSEELCASARRWAAAAVEAFVQEAPDHAFAVHHMAVAVEHVSKGCLASISDVLLAPEKPSLHDLLLLSGNENRVPEDQRSRLRTASGAVAAERVAKLRDAGAGDAGLVCLREVRNGVTHLGLRDEAGSRELLAAGIAHVNELLEALGREVAAFWGSHLALTVRLVEQVVEEAQLRYEHKLQQARERFERQFGKMTPANRAEAISALAAHPVLSRWRMALPWRCPACDSAAVASGREYDDDVGAWFVPRYFGCRVCGLTLEGAELDSAGITGLLFDRDEDMPDGWEPDFDAMRKDL